MMTNRMRFDQLEYSKDSPVVKESSIKYFNVPTLQEFRIFKVKESILEREDNLLMAVESVTGDEDEYFDIVEGAIAFRSPFPNYQARLVLAFEMSPDVTFISRDVYNSFMLLGDVGGFSGILFSIGAVIVGLFTHNNPENYLTRKLFTPYDRNDPNLTGKKAKSNELNPKEQYAFKEYLQDNLPSICLGLGCLKLRKRDRIFAEARDKLSDELDVVQLLQKLRFFDKALRQLLPQTQLKKLSNEARFVTLSTQESS